MSDTPQLEQSATKEDVRTKYNLKSIRTVENWMRDGWIPYLKLGKLVRFDLNEVDAALRKRCGKNLKKVAA